jgi:YggT family protein
MFVLSNFLVAMARVLDVVLTFMYWLILIRAVISWVNPDPYNSIVQFLYKTTEPLLYPIRKILPFSLKLGIDISPIIAFLTIMFLKSFLVSTILDLAARYN